MSSFDKFFIIYVVYLCYLVVKGGGIMKRLKRKRKNTKRVFNFLHSVLIVAKYFLKIAQVLKSIIDLFL